MQERNENYCSDSFYACQFVRERIRSQQYVMTHHAKKRERRRFIYEEEYLLECGFEIKGGELAPQGEIIGFEKSVISVP